MPNLELVIRNMTKIPSSRNLLALPLLAFGCLEVSGEDGRDETVPDGPNIILIMVDDMGWSDIGCYGSEITPPNIDRLAKAVSSAGRWSWPVLLVPMRMTATSGFTRWTFPF